MSHCTLYCMVHCIRKVENAGISLWHKDADQTTNSGICRRKPNKVDNESVAERDNFK